ncbi:glycosyltransferase family 39 protein [Halobacterium salinarum]|uniref:ArnT family glycosyltransferase n=1 Tax=Halobacterium salinarum TaxID=2242 RepID=UPI0025526C75|nr:glycosyltransferase family 39 protein [Halobacterium salinarum]MDL0138597.1 glycosyltransferase family 39 protein [Halobacterium salinarum]
MSAAQFSVMDGHWVIPFVPYNAFGGGASVGPEPFLIKPPLGIWFQMFSMETFGTSVLAGRLPSAVFALLTAIVTYYIGRLVYSRETGFIAAIVFLTTRIVLHGSHGGRAAALDTQMVFFGTVMVGAILWGLKSEKLQHILFSVAGISLSAAILTKGFGAGIYPLIVLPLAVVHWRTIFTRAGVYGLIATFTPAFLWFALATVSNPSVLVDMFNEQVVNRVSGSKATYSATFEFMKAPYFRKAPDVLDPWFYAMLPSLGAVPLGIYSKQGRSTLATHTLFLCWWALSVFAFFTVTGNHLWYIMPAVIPLGILCGILIDRGLRPSPEAAGLVVGVYLICMRSDMIGDGIQLITRGAVSPTPPARFVLATSAVAILLGIIYRRQWMRKTLRTNLLRRVKPTTVKRLFAISMIILLILQVPVMEMGHNNQEQVGKQVQTGTPANATIHLYPSNQGPIYSFVFASERVFDEATARELNNNTSIQYALVDKSKVSDISRPHQRIGELTSYRQSSVIVSFNSSESVQESG